MGYPYGDTYLEQIKKSQWECDEIREAYFVLLNKYCRDNHCDDIDLTLEQMFSLLAEAIVLRSSTLHGINDEYHFVWDVLDELFPEDLKKYNISEKEEKSDKVE